MGKPLTKISEDTEKGTVSFKFMGGTSADITSVSGSRNVAVPFYTLQGVEMGHDWNLLPKGLYISNGKKVVKH